VPSILVLSITHISPAGGKCGKLIPTEFGLEVCDR
jgi:hypothetical protein